MIRSVDGIRTTGVEATLTLLAHLVDAETLEVGCEDARRRRLTSVAALRAYLDRWQQRGRPGQVKLRELLANTFLSTPPQHRQGTVTANLEKGLLTSRLTPLGLNYSRSESGE
jgi:hypothetical protein